MGKKWIKILEPRQLLEKHSLNIQLFNKKINNKKVILVTPSSSLLLKENGAKIDNNFDTVIRIGHGYETDGLEEYTGTRTDILYHGLKPSPKKLSPYLVESYGVGMVCYVCNNSITPRGVRFRTSCKAKGLDVKVIPRPSWKSRLLELKDQNDLKSSTNGGFKPLYGVGALSDILSAKPKELHLYGADFYESGHQPNYDARDRKFKFKFMRRMADKYHNIARNKIYTAELLLLNTNTSIDNTTFKALVKNKWVKNNLQEELSQIVKEI